MKKQNFRILAAGELRGNDTRRTGRNNNDLIILTLPLEVAYLFTRGQPAKQMQKYDLRSHERYGFLHEDEQEMKDGVLISDLANVVLSTAAVRRSLLKLPVFSSKYLPSYMLCGARTRCIGNREEELTNLN